MIRIVQERSSAIVMYIVESIKYFPGIMSDIKLVSEEYTSKFVTGPALDQKLANKQDNLHCYSESNGKVNIASDGATLKLDSCAVDISTNMGGRILYTDPMGHDVYLGNNSGNGDTYCQGRLFDKNNNEITGGSGGSGGSKWVTDDISGVGITYLFLGKDENCSTVNSIFVCGPLYGDDNSIFVEGPIVFNEAMILQDYYDSNNKLLLNSSNTEHYGPCIHSIDTSIEGPTLVLVGGKGGNVMIEARDSSGNRKTAFINYNNIDKLINLLDS